MSDEHQQAIRADALAMATDLDRYAASLQLNPQYLAPVLTAQAAMRGLTEAAILDRKGTMLARTGLVFALGFEDVSKDALRRAQQGEVVDHDRRPRGAGARARPAERVQRPVSVCRAFYRAAGAGAPRAHPPRGRAIRAAGRAALRVPDHLRGDLHPGRDAVSGRGDPDRRAFRGAAGRSDQPAGRRRRTGPRRRSVGAGAGGRAATTNSARSAAPSIA